MVSCCVPDCTVTQRKNVDNYSYHRFPRDPDLYRKWLRAIDRKNWTPLNRSIVCGRHFDEKCFQNQGKKRKILRRDAIPTLFVRVQVKERTPTAYVNRNIPGTPSLRMEPMPRSSNTMPSSSKGIFTKYTKLKEKILRKNRTIKMLKARATRMSNRIVALKQTVKELNKRLGLQNCEDENNSPENHLYEVYITSVPE